MAETTKGGALIKATDGHINRGGEFEQRAAFVPTYELPVGDTVGLAFGKTGIYVFGHGEAPALPVGVAYQRLQHPDGVTALARVPAFDLYSGKIYAVGEFADGSRYHFYDGVRVGDWFDGRARAAFRVTGGGVQAATYASGSFEITAGTVGPANELSALTVDGVALMAAPVAHTGSNSSTATAVAAAINAHASTPEYTAAAVGQTVTVTASATGTAPNGKAIIATVGGDCVVANAQNFAGGAPTVTSALSALTVSGVDAIGGAVSWATSNIATAAAVAAAINSVTTDPDYVATSIDDQVNISRADNGSAANGSAVDFVLSAGFGVTPATGLVLAGGGGDPVVGVSAVGSFDITGGTANILNALSVLKVDNVSITSSSVTHTGDNATTATAVAAAINAAITAPNYSATAAGAKVTVTKVLPDSTVNGKDIVASVVGNFTVGNGQAMAGGVDAVETFQPGDFVKTIGSKMYSVSGPNAHFSGIKAPTGWTTDNVGAGFIDMASETSGSEQLTGLAKYQQFVAVFAERVTQIWYVDPDPALNKQAQVLNNTGTLSPRTVAQFGDNDIFYLDESGLRSLRARDSSNAAATTDIGVPVDALVIEKLKLMSRDDRSKIIGVIEPVDGRFWLIFPDEIFVFSYFSGSKISAWSTYTPTMKDGATVTTLVLEDAVVFRKNIYIRSGDQILVYGGLGGTVIYDDTEAELWTPYLDGDSPAKQKKLTGVDAAVEGQWSISVAMQPSNPAAVDDVAIITKTTFNGDTLPAQGSSTHFSLRFKGKGGGKKKVSSAIIHYEADEDED